MPDENSNPIGSELDRRKVHRARGGSLAIAAGGASAFALQYLSPNVLYEASPVVSVGRPEHYPDDSVMLYPRFGIFIVRANEGFLNRLKPSAVCSHLGCLCVWKPESSVIGCPCHGSVFQKDGKHHCGSGAEAAAVAAHVEY